MRLELAHAPGAVRPAGLDAAQVGQIREAARAFEALLVQTLLRAMQEAQLPGGLFGDGPGASVYHGLWEQHLSDAVTQGSPFGIARQLEELWLGQGAIPPEVDELRRAQAAAAYESATEVQEFPGLLP